MIIAGIHTMTMDTYQADPCPEPSLSSGIVRALLMDSPRHAWVSHPRLNPACVSEESETFDLGTAAHAYLLQGESRFEIIDAPDWRTKDAKASRDRARELGLVPLLAHRWADVQAMAAAARVQLGQHQARPVPFLDGQPEQTIIWEEGGVWCRARADWLHDFHRVIDDYKTTGASANPDQWGRTLFTAGVDLQAAFYLRGLRALGIQDPVFRFVVQENYAPFALAVIGLAPDALALADRKVGQAVALWRECLTMDRWPGYPRDVCYAELPPWQEAQWMERELREEQTKSQDVEAL